MTEPVWTRNEIESPCVRICVVHPETRLCTGCARSIDEIGRWSRMTPRNARRSWPNCRTGRLRRKDGAEDVRHG